MKPKSKSQASKGKASHLIEEWLDDESLTGNNLRKAKKVHQSQKERDPDLLDPSQANATVSEVYQKLCRVLVDGQEESLLCNYRRTGVFRSTLAGYRERTPVAVGDRVSVRVLGQKDGVVEGVCKRESQLSRPAPGKELGMIHVLASNVETVVIVSSVQEPSFSEGLVDRFLVASSVGKLDAIICVNKIDLKDSSQTPWKVYQDLGFEIFLVSAKKSTGIPELKKRLEGKKAVFCGHSGVGKTSLLRALTGIPEFGRVGRVQNYSGKGKHTTTGSSLVTTGVWPQSTWIDTPGVRAFGLVGVKSENLKEHFVEFSSDEGCGEHCLHIQEETCAKKELPRHSSYLRIYQSLVEEETR